MLLPGSALGPRRGNGDMRSALLGRTFGLAVLIGLAAPASAADLPEPTEPVLEPGWTFTVAPYFWATGLKGDIGVGRLPEVDVDLSFSDIMEHFDIGVMGTAEAR